jgi:hypothetical protein
LKELKANNYIIKKDDIRPHEIQINSEYKELVEILSSRLKDRKEIVNTEATDISYSEVIDGKKSVRTSVYRSSGDSDLLEQRVNLFDRKGNQLNAEEAIRKSLNDIDKFITENLITEVYERHKDSFEDQASEELEFKTREIIEALVRGHKKTFTSTEEGDAFFEEVIRYEKLPEYYLLKERPAVLRFLVGKEDSEKVEEAQRVLEEDIFKPALNSKKVFFAERLEELFEKAVSDINPFTHREKNLLLDVLEEIKSIYSGEPILVASKSITNRRLKEEVLKENQPSHQNQ